MKILVVGAGPTGLAAGVELARRGFDVELFEKRKGGSTLSRAVGINPRSLQILEASGITEQLIKQGISYQGVSFYHHDKPAASFNFTKNDKRHKYGIMIGLAQNITEELLREKFLSLGGKLHYDTEVVDFEQNDKEVTITLQNGDKFTGDYVLGADGKNSNTRQFLKIDYKGYDLPGVWSIADVEVESLDNADRITIFLLNDGNMAALAPLQGKRCRVISNTKNALEAIPIPLNVLEIHREGKFDVAVRQVEHYSRGRIFLAGDAAHCHSPAGGRGMNLGISNAYRFAHCLKKGTLSDYESECHAEGKIAIDDSEIIRKMVTSTGIKRFFIFIMLKTVAQIPFLQKIMTNKVLHGE